MNGLVATAAGVAHTSEIFSSSKTEEAVVINHTVEIKDFVFLPASLEVKPGESFTLTVTEAMQLDYFCAFHPMMKAFLKLKK